MEIKLKIKQEVIDACPVPDGMKLEPLESRPRKQGEVYLSDCNTWEISYGDYDTNNLVAIFAPDPDAKPEYVEVVNNGHATQVRFKNV